MRIASTFSDEDATIGGVVDWSNEANETEDETLCRLVSNTIIAIKETQVDDPKQDHLMYRDPSDIDHDPMILERDRDIIDHESRPWERPHDVIGFNDEGLSMEKMKKKNIKIQQIIMKVANYMPRT